jgi:hypothetical protein
VVEESLLLSPISDFNVNLDWIYSSSSFLPFSTPRSIALSFFGEKLLPEIKYTNSLNNITNRNNI